MFEVSTLLSTFGLAGIYAIVFMETGLLIGFIFPGDTLLFTAGIMASAPEPFAPLWALMLGIPISAIIGDQVGYTIGKRVGPAIMRTRVAQWIGPEYIDKTNHFFDRFGPATILLARFIAVVRTVTPVMAGFSRMNRKAFTLYSIIGSIAWGTTLPALGYFLGEIPLVERYMHWFIAAGLLTVAVPMSIQLWRLRRANVKTAASNSPALKQASSTHK